MNFCELYIACDNIMDDDEFYLYVADKYIGKFTAEEIYHHELYSVMRISRFSVKSHKIRL